MKNKWRKLKKKNKKFKKINASILILKKVKKALNHGIGIMSLKSE